MLSIFQKSLFKSIALTLLSFLIVLGIGKLNLITPVIAQNIIQPETVAAMVYEKFPDIPLENQYISKESGEIAKDNTLMSRFVRYHRDVQRRAMIYRFDWQLTFADYLGANQPIKPETYPSYNTLNQNPAENDIKAIQSLNRRQRSEIVDLIATIYQSENQPSPQKPTENPENTTPKPDKPPIPSNNNNPSLSKPGDAQLLMP